MIIPTIYNFLLKYMKFIDLSQQTEKKILDQVYEIFCIYNVLSILSEIESLQPNLKCNICNIPKFIKIINFTRYFLQNNFPSMVGLVGLLCSYIILKFFLK